MKQHRMKLEEVKRFQKLAGIIKEEEQIGEAISPEVIDALATGLAGVAGVLATAGGIAKLQDILRTKYPKAAETLEKLGSSASSGVLGGTTSRD